MFEVLEGVYAHGKIMLPQIPEIHDQTRVLIITVGEPLSLIHEATDASEQWEIALEMPGDLNEIDVSVGTGAYYQTQLAEAARNRTHKGTLHSPFFSAPPVDLGYTDAAVIDTIMAEGTEDDNLS